MNMDCTTIVTSYGLCRCCMTKGNHRDITKEYYHNGIREVFQDIFLECYNLCMVKNPQLSTLICSSCVSRLREASSFRMMVVSTERELLDALIHNEDKHTVFVNAINETQLMELEANVKIEAVKEEACSDDVQNFECDALSGGEAGNDVEICTVEGEKELLSRFPRETLKPLPTRKELHRICPNYVKQLSLLQDMIVTSSTIKNLLSRTSNSLNCEKTYITAKLGQVLNTTTLLEFSNITPFKSRARAGFCCFYCSNLLESLSKLREHSLEHNKTDITKILKTYIPDRLVVNVDVTDLQCTLCEQPMKNINTLKTHLSGVHNKILYQEFSDRVIPFKSTSSNMYECQVCGCNFETFGAVERHMNVHYRNYVCSQCGMGFVTQNRLKVHMYNTHVQGKFPCDQCKKVFVTKQKYKTHVNVIHKMLKRFKCIKCSERFTEYFHRQKHMSEVHGIAIIQYKCNVCDKSFERRYALSRHMKRDHLEERDHHCALCSYKCFTSNELGLHMVKHSGEKKFECSICKKSYARKKTLREHMKIHNNDRRFCCAVCSQAFVQKCSLKGHMRTHHMEYSVQ